MNPTFYAGTPKHLLNAGNLPHEEAPSAERTPEPAAPTGALALGTGSGPAAHLVRVIDAIIADAETRWVLNNPGKKSNLKNADIRVEVSIRTLRSASQLLGQNT